MTKGGHFGQGKVNGSTHPLDRINALEDSPLLLAARNGHLDTVMHFVQLLADEGVEDVGIVVSEHVNRHHRNVLHEAASHCHLALVQYCLQQLNIPADCIKRSDYTPLMLVMVCQDSSITTQMQLEVVDLLLNFGADVHLQNKDGWTAFFLAARQGNVSLMEMLIQHDPRVIDIQSKNGRTPLHSTSMFNRLDATRLLVSLPQVEVDKPDSCGTTPFMDACTHCHIQLARILVQHGADFRRCDSVGREPLHLAAQAGHWLMVQYLLDEMHVPADLVDSTTQCNIVHFAAKQGHIDLMQRLRDSGVFVEHGELWGLSSLHGRTAVHLAVMFNRVAVVQHLITQCAQVISFTAVDDTGHPAEFYARSEAMKALFV